jgi:hypothetical protein
VPHLLSEGMKYKDLVGMMKPTIHIDEFASKMGDDDEIVVASFFVRDRQAAKDLVNWFEKGYDFVLDADMSPGEIKPNRYLVYVEMKRRSTTGEKLQELLDDFHTLTEHEGSSWTMHYRGEEYPFSVDTFDRVVPTSPAEYRKREEKDLNEMRHASGLPVKQIYKRERDIKSLQSAAGLI